MLFDYMVSLVNLYGLVPIKKVVEIYNLQNEDKVSVKDVERIIENRTFDLKKCFVEAYENYLVNDFILDEYDVDEEINERKGIPFYVPNKTQLMKYRDDLYSEQPKEFVDLHRYLTNEFYDGDDIMAYELCEEIQVECEFDFTMEGALSCCEMLGKRIENRDQLEKVVKLIQNLNNNTRKWENNGFTPNELGNRRF